MKRPALAATALALTLPFPALAAAASTAGAGAASATAPSGADHGLPSTYELDGDPGDPQGSKFEGIGIGPGQARFYVSETTGGEIHRGHVRSGDTEVWLPEGEHGRVTARGITTDRHGRVYIAGGPNSTLPGGSHDMWVHGPGGRLLAALDAPVDAPFINDVAIGPDGAAYFTNSNAPVVFRVARVDGAWTVDTWADATATIPTQAGFNLGGIVVSPDRSALIVAQGNTGQLWRFDLGSRAVTEVATSGANLTNADGLVLRDRHLLVVRNFSRVLTALQVDASGTSASVVLEVATDPDRVFTTAKLARGRLLLVDSKFDEPVAAPPYQVVALPLPG